MSWRNNLSAVLVPAAFAFATAASGAQMPKLTVVSVDSEETVAEDTRGANAVDGNPDTIWHTQWQDATPAHPHEIVIKLDPPSRIKGVTYLPRQGDNDHGTIRDYEIYLGDGASGFGTPVKAGAFEAGRERKTVEFEAKQCGYVKLVARSEINGEAWASAAEIGVVLDSDRISGKPRLRVVRVDSEETAADNARGGNAVDGKPDTIWHTQWRDATPGHPHEIVIELEWLAPIKGFTYLPRQDPIANGRIKDFEFYVSRDGTDFGEPAAKGTWENNTDLKRERFGARECRFIKLRSLSEVNDEAWASAAEIDVIVHE